MKLEMLLMGGDKVIRDTNELSAAAIERYKPFKIKCGELHCQLDAGSFLVIINAMAEGAIFQLQKSGATAYLVVCCFSRAFDEVMCGHVADFQQIFQYPKAHRPGLEHWVHIIPVEYGSLSHALQIEAMFSIFAIYHALAVAKNEGTAMMGNTLIVN